AYWTAFTYTHKTNLSQYPHKKR
ncbi:hypothetical protein AVEN_257456-1, partial [Araneus ventricosus]